MAVMRKSTEMPKRVTVLPKKDEPMNIYELSTYVMGYIDEIFDVDDFRHVTLEKIDVGSLMTTIYFNWSTTEDILAHSNITIGNTLHTWECMMRTLATFITDITVVQSDILRLAFKGKLIKVVAFDEECKEIIYHLDDGSTEVTSFEHAFTE